KKVGIYPTDGLLLELLLFSNQWKGDISPENRSEYIIAQAFKEILPKVSKTSLRLALPLPHDERLKKIVQFLDDNMDSSITMKKITAEFGFSERSLSRLFQKDLAMTFVQYFTILRMLRALQLLIDGSYSISEISNMVGYNSLPTFSNTFQKVIGVRPTDYSKKKDIL
ncbi:MAG: AraC family transcriptional regulator, partial [Algoriella sp.]